MTSAPLELPSADTAADWLKSRTDDALAKARSLADGLKESAPGTALETLRVWDEVTLTLGSLAGLASLMSEVHPVEAVRTTGEDTVAEVDKLNTELSQDAELYAVFDGLDASGLEHDPARFLDKILTDFRRAGVDKDDATRKRLKEINERLVELDQDFSRVIRNDVRSIKATREQLDGLPEDWFEAHPAGDDGLITVTTDYPDYVPARMFVHDASIRADLTTVYLNRGYPHNEDVLKEMFDLRHELANLVGYPDWPSYDADVKMIGSGPAIPEFIDRIADAAEGPSRRDLEVLLERYRQDVPGATDIASSDAGYYEELVRKEQFDVDSQLVRTYFEFPKVRQGLLDVTGRLFGLRYEPVEANPWHEDVAVYDVYRVDGDARPDSAEGAAIGRIYLDLHPREGKYKHAAQFDLATGVSGRQLPEGALVCNFSKGLMEHDHVVTLFHEFGHLVHHILGGQGEWARFSGVATEWDFVEAPSQMLEEWAWDADILRSFATNAAGEPIPAELVEKMRKGDEFGKGYLAKQQMFYAALSYYFHQERPADLTARLIELQAKYSPWRYVDDTHMHDSFGHLGGYSSGYYTYMWSLVIAKDMFSAFDPNDMFNAEVAGRYRDKVLAPGGSRPAADLVADFLGRPTTFDAYAEWLAS